MKRMNTRALMAAALTAAGTLAQGAAAQEENTPANDDALKVTGQISARAGTHAAAYTYNLPYLPVYKPLPGSFAGGALNLKKPFGDAVLGGGAYAFEIERIKLGDYSDTQTRYVLAGGSAQAEKIPGFDRLHLYGYARQEIGGADQRLWNAGGDIETAGQPLGGDAVMKLRLGTRTGGETDALDPPMSYALLGGQAGAFSLYAGAFVPHFDTPQFLAEAKMKLGDATSASLQAFTDMRDDKGAGPYVSRLALSLSHAFTARNVLHASAVVSPRGLEEGLLRAQFNETQPGFFANVISGAARNPATGRTLPTGRLETGWRF